MLDKPRESKPQVLADYICGSIEAVSTKYVSDHIVRGRRICLYGIRIHIETTKKGIAKLSPEIPAMGPLLKLIHEYPAATDFSWLKAEKKWRLAIYESGGGE